MACAVHAKGKPLEVAAEIARAASAALPEHVEDFAPALRAALAKHGNQRFNVIIDALDEATSPEQARIIITKVILPLAETCADVGAQVIAGSRRSVGDVDLLAAFGESMEKLDLDDPGCSPTMTWRPMPWPRCGWKATNETGIPTPTRSPPVPWLHGSRNCLTVTSLSPG